MTQGLYEQLGVGINATAQDLLAAYHHRATRIVERKSAISRKGGDFSKLDIDRDQLDTAYTILSDPKRRRLYNAMLSMTEGHWDASPEHLWSTMHGAFATPKRRAAMELLNQLTKLNIPTLPPAPQPNNQPMTTPPFHTEGTDGRIDSAPFSVVSASTPVSTSVAPTQTPTIPPLHSESPSHLRVITPDHSPAPDTQPDIISVKDLAHTTIVEDPTDFGGDVAHSLDHVAAISQHGFTGALLSALRESGGLSLDDVAQQTNIKRDHIMNLEAENVSALPHKIYVYGYSKNYAELYGLDGESFATAYTARIYG